MTKLLLSRKELIAILGMSDTTFERRRKEGQILDPIPGLGGSHDKWSLQDVTSWVDAGAPAAEVWRGMRTPEQAAGVR